jgi:hypothetical protein
LVLPATDVGASAEAAAGASDDDAADGLIVGGVADGVDEFGLHDAGPGVEAFGPVEGDGDDAALLFVEELFVVGHGGRVRREEGRGKRRRLLTA